MKITKRRGIGSGGSWTITQEIWIDFLVIILGIILMFSIGFGYPLGVFGPFLIVGGSSAFYGNLKYRKKMRGIKIQ